MHALHGSRSRFARGLAIGVVLALAAMQPLAARASGLPTIGASATNGATIQVSRAAGNQVAADAAVPLPSAPFCASHHYPTGASAHYSVLRVGGSCFPFPGSVHVAIRDMTTGAVLRNWVTVPLAVTSLPPGWGGHFQYVTQGDARPGDAIRFWIVDGAWHRIVTVADTP